MTQEFTVANLLRHEADALDASDAEQAIADRHWLGDMRDKENISIAIAHQTEAIILEHMANAWKRIRKAFIAARWHMPVEEALTFVAEEGESALHMEERDRELIEALRRMSDAILADFV